MILVYLNVVRMGEIPASSPPESIHAPLWWHPRSRLSVPLFGLILMSFVFLVAWQDKTTSSQIANRAGTGEARERLVCESRRSSSLARNSSLDAVDGLETTSIIAGNIIGASDQLC